MQALDKSSSAAANRVEPRSWQTYALLALAIFAAAVTPIAIRFAQIEGVASLAIIFMRLSLASLVLLPVIWRRYRPALRRLSREDLLWTLAAGGCHALGLVLLFFSLEYTSVLINSVLRQTSPLWVLVLEVVTLHAAFRRRVWLGVVLAIAGTLIVGLTGVQDTAAGRSDLIGGVLALMNALFIAGYLILGRKLRGKLPFIPYSWVIFVAAGLLSAVFVWVTGTPLLGYSWAGYGWVVVVTITAQFMGHLSINASLRSFPATIFSVIMQSSVIISAVLAFFTLGELPTLAQIVGSGVILLGVVLVTTRTGGKPG